MKILCHRGLWYDKSDQNSLQAFQDALNRGYGIETDIRDQNGELVVSHDIPVGGVLNAREFFSNYAQLNSRAMLALNIKSDGLQDSLEQLLIEFQIKRYFVFDMSIPDSLGYIRRSMPIASRLSEFESPGPLSNKANYVWLDAFESEWYADDLVEKLVEQGKSVVIVSPELHRRSHVALWERLRHLDSKGRLYLCTDLIKEAEEVFDVETD